MATRTSPSKTKRDRTIPVKVSVDPRPAPTTLPPMPASDIQPKRPVAKPNIVSQMKKTAPLRAIRQPVHEWPEARRRKLMWWLVGGGTAVVIIGWLALVRLEVAGGTGQNLLTEAKKLFSTLHLPGTKQSTAAEKEIRQLDSQVFPQFQQ